jgi:hypothetical protein
MLPEANLLRRWEARRTGGIVPLLRWRETMCTRVMAPLWRRWEAIVISIGSNIALLSESRGIALCERIVYGCR